jgi:hypothetical protein
VAEHDPADVALGRVAIERGLLERGRALSLLERATREGCGFLDAARREPGLEAILPALEALAAELSPRPGPDGVSTVAAAPPRSEARLKPGDRFAEHTIEGVLGQGAMGTVYLARSDAGARRAIKVLAFDGAGERELTARARFAREAQGLGRLKPHRNIVPVHSAGLDGEHPFCVLDLIEGSTLETLIEKGALPVARALEIGEQLARGLEHAHEGGIIHRDVKPANVLIRSEDGSAVLTDFGLARDLTSAERLTDTQAVLGTPLYMPPEQTGNAVADARSDVYALGATIYHMVTGRPPIEASSIEQLFIRINMQPVEPPSTCMPGVSPDLDAVLVKALQKAPADRYATAAAFGDDLGRARRGKPVAARPLTPGERLVRAIQRDPAGTARRGALFLIVVVALVALGSVARVGRRPASVDDERRAAELEAWKESQKVAIRFLDSARKDLQPALLGLRSSVDASELDKALKRLRDARTAPAGTPASDVTVAKEEVKLREDEAALDRMILAATAAIATGNVARARAETRLALEASPRSHDPRRPLEGGVLEVRLLAACAIEDSAAAAETAKLVGASARGSPLETALAFLDASSPKLESDADARQALLPIRARVLGSLEPALFHERLDRVAAFLNELARRELAEKQHLMKVALPAFFEAWGARPPDALLEVLGHVDPLALARALAAADEEDQDALGAIAPERAFVKFLDALAEAAVKASEFRVATRLYGQVVRGDPSVPARCERFTSELRADADRLYTEHELRRAVATWVDSARTGHGFAWPGKSEDENPLAELAAMHRDRPRDWAITETYSATLTDGIELLPVDARLERATQTLEVAKLLRDDRRAPRCARASGAFDAGRACCSIYRNAPAHDPELLRRAIEAFEASDADLPFPDEASRWSVLALTTLWAQTGREDKPLIAKAVDCALRSFKESRARLEQGEELAPLPGRDVPLSRQDEIVESQRNEAASVVSLFVENHAYDEAERVVRGVHDERLPNERGYTIALEFARRPDVGIELGEKLFADPSLSEQEKAAELSAAYRVLNDPNHRLDEARVRFEEFLARHRK